MGKSQKPATIDKEEAKVKAASEAAARRTSSKKGKGKSQYNIAIGAVIAACVIAALAAMGGPATKGGGNTALDAYVNDGNFIDDVMSKAEGNFTAAASPFFNKWSLADVKWGHAGISLSNMVGMPGAVQVCDGEEGLEGGAIPPSYDARDSWPSCFGPVLDSGNCSSSYATAAAEVLAMRYCIADNEKYSGLRLSAQQILSCDKKSNGCKGGGVDNVWAYIQRRGLYPDECVPYAGQKGAACKTDCEDSKKLKVMDHCILTRKKSIKHEIYNRGPVVAPLYVKKDYLVYSGGVYTPVEGSASDMVYDADGKPVLQAVTVLGWGKSHGNSYWIVRHSWGSNWGENGYARVSFDSVVHEGYAVAGTPATEQALQAAEQKKLDDEKRKEEARLERIARDERIKENRRQYEEEKAAQQAANGEAADDLDDLDDLDAELEVDLDASADEVDV
jgi:hypothetical protein